MNKEVTVEVEKADTTKVVSEKEIVEYMDSIGMKHSVKGFKYILDAVIGILTNEYSHGMCKMYTSIAEKFNTTGSRVERAIRHCIEGANLEKTNNGEFIHKTADLFRYK